MKKIFFLAICFITFNTYAQKIGVIDTEYVLQKIPAYKAAEQRLNGQITAWQSEVGNMQLELQKKKDKLEAERVLLIDQQIKEREKEILDAEENLAKLLKTRFGAMGELNTLRANLSKPFQDQIFSAIKILSEKNSLGIVLDKSDNKILFLDKKFDYTEKLLELLKIDNSKNKQEINKPNDTIERSKKYGEMQNLKSAQGTKEIK